MDKPHQLLVPAILLTIAAAALRFHTIGQWPFFEDEFVTTTESDSLFGRVELPRDSQPQRLPRILPLAYTLHYVGNQIFGRDEFGTRVLVALFGTATVPLVLVLLDGTCPRAVAVATSLLIAVWPEHIIQCQQNRFYVFAAFFSYATMLLGARFVWHPTVGLSIQIIIAAFAALLCHTLTAIGFLFVVAGIAAAATFARRPIPPRPLKTLFAGGLLLCVFGVVYLLPRLRGWNAGEEFGFSVAHSAVSMVRMLEWPVFILTLLGGLLMATRYREAQNVYWLTCAAALPLAALILPVAIVYHGSYVFPLALGPLVLAGYAVGELYASLRKTNAFVAAAWVGLASVLSLPSLVSHYVDGSRPDLRASALFVERAFRPNDRVTGFSMGAFKFYAPGIEPTIPLPARHSLDSLKDLIREPTRLWIVVQSAASRPLPPDLVDWLGTHCTHEFQLEQRRIDDRRFAVDVYLYTPRPNSLD